MLPEEMIKNASALSSAEVKRWISNMGPTEGVAILHSFRAQLEDERAMRIIAFLCKQAHLFKKMYEGVEVEGMLASTYEAMCQEYSDMEMLGQMREHSLASIYRKELPEKLRSAEGNFFVDSNRQVHYVQIVDGAQERMKAEEDAFLIPGEHRSAIH